MTTEESVVVIGGGIGGLTLAYGLARAGYGVEVVEAGGRGDRLGTGMTLLGNALRALDEIDLADEIVAAGFGWDAVSMRDAGGAVVHEQPLPPVFRPDGPRAIGIMRTRLADVLEQRARDSGAVVRFDTAATAIDQDADGASVTLSDGQTLRADLVVAADGVYSKTRAAVFGDHAPRFTGESGWRYTIPRPENLNGLALYRSGRHTIGGLPLSHDLAYLFYLEHTDERVRMPADQLGELLRERFAPFDAPELVKAAAEIDDTRHISFRPYDVLLMPGPWYRGRVALLGDAAHALTPQLTSGGGMAIEDAVVLTQELEQAGGDIDVALRAWDERRQARVIPIYENSLRICELEQDPNNDGQEGMRLMGESHMLLAQAM